MNIAEEKMDESESQGKSRLKILIVEDNFTCRRLLGIFMSKYGDCSNAANGVEAIRMFKDALDIGEPYHVVCLDLMMPAINGHMVLKQIHQIEQEHGIGNLEGVKVIITTAIDEPEDIERVFNEGCNAYIVKPITGKGLSKEMQKLGFVERENCAS